MEIQVACPERGSRGGECGTLLTVKIDTQGDPSVGMGPDGVTLVQGPCIHVARFNAALEDNGEDALNVDFPALAGRILGAVEQLAEDEADAQEAAEAAAAPAPTHYHVKLTGGPTQRTQWSYFVENPQGGGSGTNAGAGAPQRRAWAMAVTRHTGLPLGTAYRLSVNGEDRGLIRRGDEPWVKGDPTR